MNSSEALSQIRYLGAPLAIIGDSQKVELWSLSKDLPNAPAELALRTNWRGHFNSRLSDFSPTSVYAAKYGQINLPFVDATFADWAENITQQTLFKLLESLFADAIKKLPRAEQKNHVSQQAVIRVVCHLFAARVLEDKGVIETTDSPMKLLELAHDQFSDNIDPTALTLSHVTDAIVSGVYTSLKTKFAFGSLTTDMLGHAYENAMVTPSLRKEMGIYYTPHGDRICAQQIAYRNHARKRPILVGPVPRVWIAITRWI